MRNLGKRNPTCILRRYLNERLSNKKLQICIISLLELNDVKSDTGFINNDTVILEGTMESLRKRALVWWQGGKEAQRNSEIRL